MIRYLSPLRYPGGKGRLAPFIVELLALQRPRPSAYAEPFAGGAGAALRLLVEEHVDAIYLNDLNPGVAAFWRAAVGSTASMAEMIRTAPVDLDAWHAARAVYDSPEGRDDLELGFATFLLNRCNRSGILTARPIGGLEQSGTWKIDARFHRSELATRVERIGRYRSRIHISQNDAREFLRGVEGSDDAAHFLVYVDPPYLGQGEALYLDSLTLEDHRELATQLRASKLKWFLTYDADPRVTEELYEGLRCLEFDIAHTAARQHVGEEFAVFSENLRLAQAHKIIPRGAERWVTL